VALDQVGEWQSENGEYDKALATFSRAINAGGGSDVYTTKNMGGLLIVAKHDYHDAIEYLVGSLRIDPYQPDVISELAFCYEQLGDMQNALWNLKRGLDYLPNDPLLHRRLGEDFERLGSYQAALEQFTLALQTLPDDAESLNDRNQLLEKLKQTQTTAKTRPG
ncbi:MAG TPA: tetratricopeptide repeat protein, partial [Phycisphaerae bacterium]|nr:tetratricopeptide repeat protein [Phycisphaerae bacterium]